MFLKNKTPTKKLNMVKLSVWIIPSANFASVGEIWFLRNGPLAKKRFIEYFASGKLTIVRGKYLNLASHQILLSKEYYKRNLSWNLWQYFENKTWEKSVFSGRVLSLRKEKHILLLDNWILWEENILIWLLTKSCCWKNITIRKFENNDNILRIKLVM